MVKSKKGNQKGNHAGYCTSIEYIEYPTEMPCRQARIKVTFSQKLMRLPSYLKSYLGREPERKNMTNLHDTIIRTRNEIQHQLKYKNNGIKQKVGKADLVDFEYCKEHGKGCFAKGLRNICIEHQEMKELLNRKNGDIAVKRDILIQFAVEFIDNISLIDPLLASNHFRNLPSVIGKYIDHQEWKPELLNDDPEKTKIYGVKKKNETI